MPISRRPTLASGEEGSEKTDRLVVASAGKHLQETGLKQALIRTTKEADTFSASRQRHEIPSFHLVKGFRSVQLAPRLERVVLVQHQPLVVRVPLPRTGTERHPHPARELRRGLLLPLSVRPAAREDPETPHQAVRPVPGRLEALLVDDPGARRHGVDLPRRVPQELPPHLPNVQRVHLGKAHRARLPPYEGGEGWLVPVGHEHRHGARAQDVVEAVVPPPVPPRDQGESGRGEPPEVRLLRARLRDQRVFPVGPVRRAVRAEEPRAGHGRVVPAAVVLPREEEQERPPGRPPPATRPRRRRLPDVLGRVGLEIDREQPEAGEHPVRVVAEPRLSPFHHDVQDVVPAREHVVPLGAVLRERFAAVVEPESRGVDHVVTAPGPPRQAQETVGESEVGAYLIPRLAVHHEELRGVERLAYYDVVRPLRGVVARDPVGVSPEAEVAAPGGRGE
ncbi:hypothetical protein THAOC_11213, partial [Thalassiosira oceanica]